jgi:hypothetical protein
MRRRRAGEFLGKIRIRDYTCGLIVTMVALGLYSYYVRELLASPFLFGALFPAMGLIALGAVLAWHACEQVALWSRLVSRNAVAFAFSARSLSLAAVVNKKP